MIENIKINQIVRFCQGDKKKFTQKLPELFFFPLSPPLCQVFPQAIEKYCLLSILILLTCHFSEFQNRKSQGHGITYSVSSVPCRISNVRCQLSSHMFILFFFSKCQSKFVECLLSRGSTPSIFQTFLLKRVDTQYLLLNLQCI